jgi:hypothetical protein
MYGDIAIDDITVIEVNCSVPGDCNFDTGYCSWSNDVRSDQFDWQLTSHTTGTQNTGPWNDHTSGTTAGKYVFIDASAPRVQGDTARFFSQDLDSSLPSCMHFWYTMYGNSVGTLNVKVARRSDGGNTTLWSLSGNQGQAWQQGSIKVPPQNDSFQLIFEGVRGANWDGDIALDDIKFDNVATCDVVPAIARVGPTPVTMLPVVTTISTSKPPVTTQKPGVATNPHTQGVHTNNPGVITNKPPVTWNPPATHPQNTPKPQQQTSTDSDSGSWKTPVGVVVGLLVVLVIVGAFIYVKKTGKLNWLAFPLMRNRMFRREDGMSNPMYDYGAGDDAPTYELGTIEPKLSNIDDVFGESTKVSMKGSKNAAKNDTTLDPEYANVFGESTKLKGSKSGKKNKSAKSGFSNPEYGNTFNESNKLNLNSPTDDDYDA